MNRLYLLCFAFSFLATGWLPASLNGQSGCPGCSVNLPPLPVDTIFLSAAPDGIAGQYYDGDISFRMPKSTDPVHDLDPSTPAGLNISNVTIVSVLNVPPGLSWQPSQFSFDTQNETDGCVKFCGVPLQPGFYEVQVFVTAEVLLITQSTSFSFPMFIAPAVSSNGGFSMQNGSGCGEVTVGFDNNVPSNGQDGFSYNWDFGNGVTSTSENPGSQTYDSPGEYEVNFQASIDTFGYQLTTVLVLGTGCSDIAVPPIFSGNPDLYVKIKDPNGNLLVSTDPVDNAPYPAAFNINLMLGDGTYELEVRDDETIGSESCGYVYFNKNNTDTLVSGDLKVLVNIIHPVTTIESTDTVVVFAVPDPPVINPDGLVGICNGEEVELEVTNYFEDIQWYKDTAVLLGETSYSLLVDSPGEYWVEYASPDGCKSQSAPAVVEILALPAVPAFHAVGNQLTLNNPGQLPADYSLQWYQDGVAIPGATDTTYCFTEPGVFLFTLEVMNNATGCSNTFSLGASYNPDYNCTISGTEDRAGLDASLVVTPNPTQGRILVVFENKSLEEVQLTLFDALGKMVWSAKERLVSNVFQKEMDLGNLPSGVYFLKIQTQDSIVGRRVMKQ